MSRLVWVLIAVTMQVEQVMTDEELVAYVSVSNQPSADQDMEDAAGSEAEAE